MYIIQRCHNKTFMVVAFIAMISLKALLFGNKDKDNSARLLELNEELNNLYKILAEEQDGFEEKRKSYESGREAITNKKTEVDNRVDYLNDIKAKIGEQLGLSSSDINAFKNLCEQYVATFNGIEEARTELHGLEVELENNYAYWEEECITHETNVDNMQKHIHTILQKIAKINRAIEKKK